MREPVLRTTGRSNKDTNCAKPSGRDSTASTELHGLSVCVAAVTAFRKATVKDRY
jgi:hypothetical protein